MRAGTNPFQPGTTGQANAYQRVGGATDDETLEWLLRGLTESADGTDSLSDMVRLCITEDAGSGKSVFTRRLLAFLCSAHGQEKLFGGKPCLVVR